MNIRFMRQSPDRVFFAVAILLIGSARLPAAENAKSSEERLRQDVTYLAADALEGRGVGTPGLDKAADYIAAQFSQMGLRTDLYHGTPFQEFEITISAEMGPADENRLTLIGSAGDGGQSRPWEIKLGETMTP